jgi:hypothetical protein
MAGLKTLTINGVKYELTPEAIGAAPAGFGLGEQSIYAGDLNSAVTNGWYFYGDSAINRPTHINYGCLLVVSRIGNTHQPVQIVYGVRDDATKERIVARRASGDAGTTWSEWEYENPPLVTGVEYRTTKRYQGAVVYEKVDVDGNILWRKETDTQWRLLSTASFVD